MPPQRPLLLLSSPSLVLIPQFSTPTTTRTARHIRRTLATTPTLNMPQPLKASHVDSKTDPTVANQWHHDTPQKQQIEDVYKPVDGLKIGLLATIRPDVGLVSRSMAVAKVPILLYNPMSPLRGYKYSPPVDKRERETNTYIPMNQTANMTPPPAPPRPPRPPPPPPPPGGTV